MNQQVILWKNKGDFFKYKGNKIFYIKEGNGPNLLILHGYPYNTFDWKMVWGQLSKKYSIVALDYLGMGFSDKPKNHVYSYKEHCEIINYLMKHLKINELHILSHDLGVSIAQELLARDLLNVNEFKINSVVFMNGGLFMDVYKPRFIQRLLSQSPKPIGKVISRIISKNKINKSVKGVFGPNTQPDEQLLDELWEILNYNDGKSITYLIGRLVFDKVNHQERWISAMKTTKIPMCYICGPYDPNSGIIMANRYLEIVPNPIVKLLNENIGHWPQLEDPDSVIKSYTEFRESIHFSK